MKNHRNLKPVIAADKILPVRSKPGFTMVEIIAVVAVIAIAAAAAGGFYLGTFKNLQLEKAAKEFYLAAKYARLAAIEKQTEVYLVIDRQQGGFFVMYEETDPETEEPEYVRVSNPYTRPVTLPKDVRIDDVIIVKSQQMVESDKKEYAEKQLDGKEILSEDIVVFSPYGTADSAVVKIANDRTVYAVSVSPATAKVKVVRGETEMPMDIIDLDEMDPR